MAHTRVAWQIRTGVALLFFPCLTWAQFNSNLEGTVQDPHNAPIPTATVLLKSLATGVTSSATTGQSGVYHFNSLLPGEYELSGKHPGFEVRSVKLTLLAGQTASVDVVLQLSGANQRVDVSAQVPLVEQGDVKLMGTFSAEELFDLPLQGHDALSLATMAPGVTGIGDFGNSNSRDNYANERQIDFSANGRNMSGNQYSVDGLSTNSNILQGTSNLSPNSDTIQEIAIQVNGFSAEQAKGSGVRIQMVTKSGSNQFHGSGNYTFTNQDLYSRTVFTTKFAPFRKHLLTGTLGGPVLKDRLFFFGSGETLRSNISQQTGIDTYEAPEFVAWAKKTFPNSLGTQVLSSYGIDPGKVVTTGVARTAQNVLGNQCNTAATSFIPCAMPMIDTGVFQPSNFRNGLQYNFRVDYYRGKDRIYGNLIGKQLNTETTIVRRNVLPYGNAQDTHSIQLNWTRSITSTLLIETGFSYLNMLARNADTDQPVEKVPLINVTGQNTGFGIGGVDHYNQPNYNARSVLTWVHGRHSVKFGVEAWHGADNVDRSSLRSKPILTFNNLFDLATDKVNQQTNVIYDPLTGKPAPFVYCYLMTSLGAFVQDEWKLRSNLTLSLGLRWDQDGNPYPNDVTRMANIFLGTGSTLDQRVVSATNQVVGQLLNQSPRGVNPRVGVAWSPRSRKWSLRGGIGIYHDAMPLGEENRITSNPPALSAPTFLATGAIRPIFSLGTNTTFPFGFTLPTIPATALDSHGGFPGLQLNVGGVDPNLKASKTATYLVTATRQIGRSYVASLSYSGSYTWDAINGTDINRYAGDLLDNKLDRLIPSFGQMFYETNRNEIHYHALIANVQARMGKRATFQASYTLAKTIDYGQGGSRVNRDGAFLYPDQHEFAAYKGYSDWDVRNRVSASSVLSLPTPLPSLRFLKPVLGNWRLSTIVILQSGRPFIVVNKAAFQPVLDKAGNVTGMKPASGDYNADGYNYDYPNTPSADYTGAHDKQQFLKGLFASSAFPVPTMGTAGNLQRNLYRNPGFATLDCAVTKGFPILSERRVRMDLRFEFFNVLNRTNLLAVDGAMNSATFGRSTSSLDARVIQGGAKISF